MEGSQWRSLTETCQLRNKPPLLAQSTITETSLEKKAESIKNSLQQIVRIISRPKNKDTMDIKIKERKASEHQPSEEPTKRSLQNEQEEERRRRIYERESFKENSDELNETTIEANNEIFSQVFLNKWHNQSVSTMSSLSKLKTKEQQLGIQDFVLGKRLGMGKFGQVFLARHRKSGFCCAIKRIKKLNMDAKLMVQLVRQIKIQLFLSNPNIVKLYTFFSDERYIYLVQEVCSSGQLYGLLKKKKKLSEEITKYIVQQVCRALDYIHQCEIIHRDLKPENIIFHNGLVKICDFGWSISSKTMRETFCGTPLYISPQLLNRKNYNNKIDVWSVGILTYELLFGKVPFDINTQRDFIKIVQDEIRFSKATEISPQAKNFIQVCLKKDPRERYSIPELLEHPFIAHLDQISLSEIL